MLQKPQCGKVRQEAWFLVMKNFVIFESWYEHMVDFIWFSTCSVNYSTNAIMRVKSFFEKQMFLEFTLCSALTKKNCSFVLKSDIK